MTKQAFTEQLREKLSRLPKQEAEERISFYIEMIDDRMEEGLTEEEAVAAIGTVDEIASQIVAHIPLSKIVKEKIKPKRKLEAWEIVLLIVGFPLWFPLLASAAVVVFSLAISLYSVVWALVISLWAIFVSFAASAPVGIVAGIVFLFGHNPLAGVAVIGTSILLAGLAIFLFFACLHATKGACKLIKRLGLGIKKLFVKKEEK